MVQENDDIELKINNGEDVAEAGDQTAPVAEAQQSTEAQQNAEPEQRAVEPEQSMVADPDAEHPKKKDSTLAATLENIVQQKATEDDDTPPSNFSLNKTLGGAMLATVIQNQIKLLLLITFFLIVYITLRYQCQQKLVEIDKLEQQLVTIRYKATVFTSILTEKSRESNIMNLLEQKGDSTLQIPYEPPYKIEIPE